MLVQIAMDVDKVEKSNADIVSRLGSSDLKLAALVARRGI
jgi:hypothetical protein